MNTPVDDLTDAELDLLRRREYGVRSRPIPFRDLLGQVIGAGGAAVSVARLHQLDNRARFKLTKLRNRAAAGEQLTPEQQSALDAFASVPGKDVGDLDRGPGQRLVRRARSSDEADGGAAQVISGRATGRGYTVFLEPRPLIAVNVDAATIDEAVARAEASHPTLRHTGAVSADGNERVVVARTKHPSAQGGPVSPLHLCLPLRSIDGREPPSWATSEVGAGAGLSVFHNEHGEAWIALIQDKTVRITGIDVGWQEVRIDGSQSVETAIDLIERQLFGQVMPTIVFQGWLVGRTEALWLLANLRTALASIGE